jgi:lysophospholipase L1-like esterase
MTPDTAARLAAGTEPVRIVCFGDSVTGVYYHTGSRRAYADMLKIGLERQYPDADIEVINAGISGNTTQDALNRIDKDVLAQKPHLVTVMFGLNDMTRVPLNEYTANLAKIIAKCHTVGAEVLLSTPNAVVDTPDRPTANLERYVAAMRRVGREQNVKVVDCYAAFEAVRMRSVAEFEFLMSDAIHPNMDGHKLFAVRMAEAIGGESISLADEGPLHPSIPHSLARLQSGDAVKVYAMPPYDKALPAAIRSLYPNAQLEVQTWSPESRDIKQLAQDAKAVREMGVDLVVVAVPVDTPAHPSEPFRKSFTWVLNRALSFSHQEWDTIAVPPSVATPGLNAEQSEHDTLMQRVIAAQDVGTISRNGADTALHDVLVAWLAAQREEQPPKAQQSSLADVFAPQVIGPRQGGVILLPDQSMLRFTTTGLGDNRYHNFIIRSTDGGESWSEPEFAYEGPPASLPLLDAEGELHVFPMLARDESGDDRRDIAVNYFIDIWHVRTLNGGTKWSTPKRIFEGYVGSINNITQLRNGRIVLPFAAWIGGRPQGPPIGANEITCLFSDDGGETWQESNTRLTAPCYTEFNGSGYGACEPVLIELNDGRVYMLARTETGRLYESYSADGASWEPLRPSQFLSTDAPAGFIRLDDGRIVMFWNGAEKPTRVDVGGGYGGGVYGGRDTLHAVISDDDGRTWCGRREIYLDPTRNESPQRTGDRGTAYPMPYHAPDGKVIVMAGQGRSGATVLFDPDWLLESRHADDFSKGLDSWSVFKHFGKPERWWRDRVQGAELVDHPDRVGTKVLHVRRPDAKPGDGAMWNFPMGSRGELTVRVRLQEGFQGASLSLLDRFFNPADDRAETEAGIVLPIAPDGGVSIAHKLAFDTWHSLVFTWDLDAKTCRVTIDDETSLYLKPAYRDLPGLNYLRIRSTANDIDRAGLLVESVSVEVSID